MEPQKIVPLFTSQNPQPKGKNMYSIPDERELAEDATSIDHFPPEDNADISPDAVVELFKRERSFSSDCEQWAFELSNMKGTDAYALIYLSTFIRQSGIFYGSAEYLAALNPNITASGVEQAVRKAKKKGLVWTVQIPAPVGKGSKSLWVPHWCADRAIGYLMQGKAHFLGLSRRRQKELAEELTHFFSENGPGISKKDQYERICQIRAIRTSDELLTGEEFERIYKKRLQYVKSTSSNYQPMKSIGSGDQPMKSIGSETMKSIVSMEPMKSIGSSLNTQGEFPSKNFSSSPLTPQNGAQKPDPEEGGGEDISVQNEPTRSSQQFESVNRQVIDEYIQSWEEENQQAVKCRDVFVENGIRDRKLVRMESGRICLPGRDHNAAYAEEVRDALPFPLRRYVELSKHEVTVHHRESFNRIENIDLHLEHEKFKELFHFRLAVIEID